LVVDVVDSSKGFPAGLVKFRVTIALCAGVMFPEIVLPSEIVLVTEIVTSLSPLTKTLTEA
jgi:hypothetical protein